MDDYYGHPISERKIQLTKAGDGLSEGLDLDGITLEPGEEGIVVLRVVHAGHKVKPVKPSDPKGDYAETLTYQAVSAKVYSADEVADLDAQLTEHEAKVQELRELKAEEAKGVKRLTYDDADDADAADDDGVGPADAERHLAAVNDDNDGDGGDEGPEQQYKVQGPDSVQGGLTLSEAQSLREEIEGGVVTHPDQLAGAGPLVDEGGFYDPTLDPYAEPSPV